jgi:hypothetical protein
MTNVAKIFFCARFVAKRYKHRNLMSVINTSERLWQQLNKIQHLGVVFPTFLSWRKPQNIILFMDDVYSSENKEAVRSARRLLRYCQSPGNNSRYFSSDIFCFKIFIYLFIPWFLSESLMTSCGTPVGKRSLYHKLTTG